MNSSNLFPKNKNTNTDNKARDARKRDKNLWDTQIPSFETILNFCLARFCSPMRIIRISKAKKTNSECGLFYSKEFNLMELKFIFQEMCVVFFLFFFK